MLCDPHRANIGLLTGVVFDVLDVPSELVEDQAVLATLPEGPVARTGTGRHHYFVAPSGRGNVVIRPVPATPASASTGTAAAATRSPPEPPRRRRRHPVAAPARHPVPDAPPHAFAAMAGAWVQPA